ncbi:unnamed protein product [Rotaria sp. Silwood1]|nr:unnamed protein product [Rotaria sp. Silwood1]CAF5045946.1 unnamed protein product [Rotaria sp. Silwood1]
MNSRHGDNSRDLTSHGSFRLFHFKSEIAKCLLRKSKLQRLPLATVDSISDDDEKNEPPTKKIREVSSSVTHVIRYDGSNHWPTFISAINTTRCKNENCSKKTYWECSKCYVHLCLNSNKNCFTQYHSGKN